MIGGARGGAQGVLGPEDEARRGGFGRPARRDHGPRRMEAEDLGSGRVGTGRVLDRLGHDCSSFVLPPKSCSAGQESRPFHGRRSRQLARRARRQSRLATGGEPARVRPPRRGIEPEVLRASTAGRYSSAGQPPCRGSCKIPARRRPADESHVRDLKGDGHPLTTCPASVVTLINGIQAAARAETLERRQFDPAASAPR